MGRAAAPPIRWVVPEERRGPYALLCTDTEAEPLRILQWYLLRWQVEVTFEELRAHLGVETQRQWSERAIARTTPALFGLFSVVTLAADILIDGGMAPRTAAWYDKTSPLPTPSPWSDDTSGCSRELLRRPSASTNR